MKTRFLLVFDRKGLLTNFINEKDPVLKEEFHTKYKKIEIYSVPLWRKVDRLIMINILKEIGIILKNTWKGIKSLISLKTVAFHVPTVLSLDNQSLWYCKYL